MFEDLCRCYLQQGMRTSVGIWCSTLLSVTYRPFSRDLALNLFLGRYSVKLSQIGRGPENQNWQLFVIFYTTAGQQGTLVHKVNEYLRFFSLNAHSQNGGLGHPVPSSIHLFKINHLHQQTVKRESASTKQLFKRKPLKFKHSHLSW